MKQRRDLIVMLFIGILIGTSVIMVWNSHRNTARMENDSSTPSGADTKDTVPGVVSNTSISGSAMPFPLPPSIPLNTRVGLSVADQPAGKSVTAKNLSIEGKKWIAIYDDHEGRPGWILGATRVHEGDTGATISLLRPEGMVAGQTYYAAILNDDGDAEFNRLTDLPPLSPDKVTIVRFRAI